MKNIYLEFHARVITKINFTNSFPATTDLVSFPLPVLNQYNENACVCISTSIAIYIITASQLWLNPKKMFSAVENSSNGMSFAEAFVHLLDNHPDIFEKYSFRRLNITIENIKKSLASGFPVLIGYQVPQPIADFHVAGDEQMPTLTSFPKTNEGHAVCVIGYEPDNLICLNSWGTMYGSSGRYKFPIKNLPLITDSYCLVSRDFKRFTVA